MKFPLRSFLSGALISVLILGGALSACTFTREKTPTPTDPPASTNSPAPTDPPVPTDSPAPTDPKEDGGPRALTEEELRFFNEEFFNGDEYNIRNQFASPWVHEYDKPEDINILDVLYDEAGTGDISEEELDALLAAHDLESLYCPAFKLPADEIDRILTQHTGLTLSQTNRVGMEAFVYLEDYDAYYWMHGDTNYPGDLTVSAGTREGSAVKLYLNEGFGWSCVTLEEQEDGGYWFVSNRACEAPDIQTGMPAGEPEAVGSQG